MIEISRFEDVKQYRMGRVLDDAEAWGFSGKVLYWVASYLVDGLLVDTGCPHTAHELAAALEAEEVAIAVNTHFHEDHVGANRLLMDRGVRIFASRQSIPLIEQRPVLEPYQELVWGYPEPTTVEPLPAVVETERCRFEVIDTPGHAHGHMALVELSRGWCFSGDLLTSREPKVLRADEDIYEIMRSMRKLIDLDTERLVLFTALGNIIEDGREALRSCIAYLEDLSGQAGLLAGEGLSAPEIMHRVFGRDSVLSGLTRGSISSIHLIHALLKPPGE
ncbi:MAG: MBL fold metallo-hydrolase [Dehalococcoidia bacterium]|nr:MBL fold metallo-hydrolase [Dehalococcoidia bacterium]